KIKPPGRPRISTDAETTKRIVEAYDASPQKINPPSCTASWRCPKEVTLGRAKDQLLMEKKVEMVPPDGGWGWVVVFAFALSNVIIVPIIQSFGLLFRGRFDQLELSGTDASVIINVNSSFGMMLGLFNGYILRSYGYRKVAIVGAITYSLGVILTSNADSFIYFLITYETYVGIQAIGFNLLTSSFNLALNSYFKEKRSKAVGFATTAMGLGPVLMPLFISVLMGLYGTSGTAFLLGGLALHSLVAALLLQPIKWHMKPKQLSPEELEEANESEDILHDTGTQNGNTLLFRSLFQIVINMCTKKPKILNGENEHTRRQRTVTNSSSIDHDIDVQSIYGFETPLPDRRTTVSNCSLSLLGIIMWHTSHMEELPAKQRPADVNWWTSAASINSVNLGSSVRIFDEKSYQPLQDFDSKNGIRKEGSKKNINEDDSKTALTLAMADANGIGEDEETKEKERTFWQKVGRGIVTFFDLTLFKDPIYVSLMFRNVSGHLEYSNSLFLHLFFLSLPEQVRKFSFNIIIGITRTLSVVFDLSHDSFPIITDPKSFSFSDAASVSASLIFSESFNAVLTVAVALGVAKGVRTVYMTIVIPNYVPIERLAAASGIQMVTNGLLLIVFGPLTDVVTTVNFHLCRLSFFVLGLLHTFT
ncbi:hypothetical protein L9F63_026348, partial [Diploptera punctata]